MRSCWNEVEQTIVSSSFSSSNNTAVGELGSFPEENVSFWRNFGRSSFKKNVVDKDSQVSATTLSVMVSLRKRILSEKWGELKAEIKSARSLAVLPVLLEEFERVEIEADDALALCDLEEALRSGFPSEEDDYPVGALTEGISKDELHELIDCKRLEEACARAKEVLENELQSSFTPSQRLPALINRAGYVLRLRQKVWGQEWEAVEELLDSGIEKEAFKGTMDDGLMEVERLQKEINEMRMRLQLLQTFGSGNLQDSGPTGYMDLSKIDVRGLDDAVSTVRSGTFYSERVKNLLSTLEIVGKLRSSISNHAWSDVETLLNDCATANLAEESTAEIERARAEHKTHAFMKLAANALSSFNFGGGLHNYTSADLRASVAAVQRVAKVAQSEGTFTNFSKLLAQMCGLLSQASLSLLDSAPLNVLNENIGKCRTHLPQILCKSEQEKNILDQATGIVKRLENEHANEEVFNAIVAGQMQGKVHGQVENLEVATISSTGLEAGLALLRKVQVVSRQNRALQHAAEAMIPCRHAVAADNLKDLGRLVDNVEGQVRGLLIDRIEEKVSKSFVAEAELMRLAHSNFVLPKLSSRMSCIGSSLWCCWRSEPAKC